MKPIALAGVVATAFLAALPASGAAWSDNFDSYPTGSVSGQGGWSGWADNAAAAGTVTAAVAASSPNSLQIVRGNDTVHTFSGVNSGVWTLSLDQFVPSTAGGSTWTILMNQYPSSLNWSAQVLADINGGLIGVFDGAGTLHGAALPLVKDQWVTMRFAIDFSASSATAYYNNAVLGTFPWTIALGAINALQAIDLYADENTAAGTAQVGSVYYDNLTLVPEPTSLSLLALGGLALAFRRKLA